MTPPRNTLQQRINLTSASDQMLLELTRDGMSEAFGELWSRHSGAVTAAARSSTGYEADDLMQEAFLKVYASIQSGGALPVSFRAYVATAARRLAIDRSRKENGAQFDSFEEEFDHGVLSEADFSERVLDDSTTAQAFKALPNRHREALWYRDVEDLPVQEVARYLGMTPNATTVLIKRARDAFKTAWIGAQLSPKRDLPPECAVIVPKLAGYSRGKLSVLERGRIEVHLLDCVHCAALESEADGLHRKLALVLLPLLLLGGAPAYLSWIQSGKNRTPIPAAHYVDVALAGVRRSPAARGAGARGAGARDALGRGALGQGAGAQAAGAQAAGTRGAFGLSKRSLVAAAAAVSLLAVGAGAVAVRAFDAAAESAPQAAPRDGTRPGAERDGVAVDRPAGHDGAPAEKPGDAFDLLGGGSGAARVETLLGAASGASAAVPVPVSVVPVVDPEIPADAVLPADPAVPADPAAPAAPVLPDPIAVDPDPDPVTYPTPRAITFATNHTYLFINVTPGATVSVSMTRGTNVESAVLVDDGGGRVYFNHSSFTGIVLLEISQEYDTAEGRVLDPAVLSQYVNL